MVLFHVLRHRVCFMRFVTAIACTNLTTNQTYARYFIGERNMPPGRPFSRRGYWHQDWLETDGGRDAHIYGEIHFGARRPFVDITLFVPRAGNERCHGAMTLDLRRAPRTPPIPPGA